MLVRSVACTFLPISLLHLIEAPESMLLLGDEPQLAVPGTGATELLAADDDDDDPNKPR